MQNSKQKNKPRNRNTENERKNMISNTDSEKKFVVFPQIKPSIKTSHSHNTTNKGNNSTLRSGELRRLRTDFGKKIIIENIKKPVDEFPSLYLKKPVCKEKIITPIINNFSRVIQVNLDNLILKNNYAKMCIKNKEMNIDKSKEIKCAASLEMHEENEVGKSDFLLSNKIDILKNLNSKFSRKSVRNQIPKPNKNNSDDTWEYVYFEHILNLKNIFEKGINSLNFGDLTSSSLTDSEGNKKLTLKSKNLKIYMRSVDFLEEFCIFLRYCSSGEISPYIENLSDKVNDMYLEFIIKRNEN